MKHRVRLAKLAKRLLPDGRPTSITIMDLAGTLIYGRLAIAFPGQPAPEIVWCDPQPVAS